MVLCLLDDASVRCTFFQETRMCIRRCLHSSMKSILCTASWDQSRTIQTAPHCPCPESFSWDAYWTGRRLFCCRSCWRDCRWGWFSIFLTSSRTRSLSACFTTECGNPRILKSMSSSFTIDCSWFASRITANNGSLRSIMICSIFHIEVRVKRSRQTSVPFYHDLGLSLVGLVVFLWIVEQLVHLFVEQLLNSIISSNHVAKKSLEEDEVTQKLFRLRLLQFPSEQLSGYNKLEVFRRGWWRSIVSDTSIFSSEQCWCRPILRILMSLPCFPHGCARRGASNSIVSRCLRSLSKGSTNRKNTVCLLLKIWRPGINLELMMECRLIAYPTWLKNSKIPSKIMTVMNDS